MPSPMSLVHPVMATCWLAGAVATPADPRIVAKLVGDAFLKSSSPPVKNKFGE